MTRTSGLIGSSTRRGYLLLLPAITIVALLLLLPLIVLTVLSFWTQKYFDIQTDLTLANFRTIFAVVPTPKDGGTWLPWAFKNPIYAKLIYQSIVMSLTVTAVVVLLAYPVAYFVAFRVKRKKMAWLVVFTLPFWTSYLLRVFAWKLILGYNGVINATLLGVGIIHRPLEILLYNSAAVIITLVHSWIAFAVMPIYVSLEKIDRSLIEAAADLGDIRLRRFLRVTLPLSLPGVVAASLLVFIPTVGDYVTPTLVGGTSGIMIGNVVQSLFGKANNAPLGAAVSLVTMLTVTLIACGFVWLIGRGSQAGDRR